MNDIELLKAFYQMEIDCLKVKDSILVNYKDGKTDEQIAEIDKVRVAWATYSQKLTDWINFH